MQASSDVSGGPRPAKTGAGSSDQVAKNGCFEPRRRMRSLGASRLQHRPFIRNLPGVARLHLSACIFLGLSHRLSTHRYSACLRDQGRGRPTTIGRPVAAVPTIHDPDPEPDPAPPRDVAHRPEALDLPHLVATAELGTVGVAASLGVGAEMTGRVAPVAVAAEAAARVL